MIEKRSFGEAPERDPYFDAESESETEQERDNPPRKRAPGRNKPQKRASAEPKAKSSAEPKADNDMRKKIIVVAVLIGVVVLLAASVGLISTCDSCSCGSCTCTCGGDDSAVSPASPDAADPVSPSDDVSPADEGEIDASAGSSCSGRQADNAAGAEDDAKESFLSFLFGCGGCATQRCSTSLTDPVDGEDVSGSNAGAGGSAEAGVSVWEAQPDDAAFESMLNEKLQLMMSYTIQLSSMDTAFAQYKSSEKVGANEKFSALSLSIKGWCAAANSYDSSLLGSDRARELLALAQSLASSAETYITSYPALISGEASASDALPSREQLLDDVSDAQIALYEKLWGLTREGDAGETVDG